MGATHHRRSIRMGFVTALLLQGPTLLNDTAAQATVWAPAPKPADFAPAWHPICTSDSQLDCLESVGAYINGTLVKGTATGRVETNSFNNSIHSEWKIPGLVNEDGKDLVQTQLRSRQLPGGQIGMSIEMYVSSQDGFKPRWESARTDCTFNKNLRGECFRFGNPQVGIKYVATFRTSWILPSIVSGSLDEADAKVEKLTQSGASRVTVAGIPMTYQLRDNAIAGQKDEAGLALLKWFRFDVTDGRFLPRPWECLDSAPPLIFGNGVGGGSAPTFTDGQLDFQVGSPHFEPDGVTKFLGVYNATIPVATAECMWKSKLTASEQLSVSVFESTSGETQTATTSINIGSDVVKIRSTGFTYSTKTVRIAQNSNASSTVAAPASSTKPARPTSIKGSGGKGSVRVTFKKVKGLTYSVVATKGKAKKSLTCSSRATTVTCSARGLAKGTWKVSVTPRQGSTRGTPGSASIRVF